MGFYQQRRNMVEQQIRTWEVLDDRILDMYYVLERDLFLPKQSVSIAYTDTLAPIGHNQVALEPKVEARMLQELEPQPDETILHVGTGSGYFAGLLSKLCKKVVTVEIIPELATEASLRFKTQRLSNIDVITQDFFTLSSIQANPFDALVLTGSVEELTPNMLEHVKDTGRLLVPFGSSPVTTVSLIQRVKESTIKQDLFDTYIPPLTKQPHASSFSF